MTDHAVATIIHDHGDQFGLFLCGGPKFIHAEREAAIAHHGDGLPPARTKCGTNAKRQTGPNGSAHRMHGIAGIINREDAIAPGGI